MSKSLNILNFLGHSPSNLLSLYIKRRIYDRADRSMSVQMTSDLERRYAMGQNAVDMHEYASTFYLKRPKSP